MTLMTFVCVLWCVVFIEECRFDASTSTFTNISFTNMITVRYTRNLFLRALCIVYLSAFLSFYIQIPGLYGDNGILPARSVLENSKHKTLLAKIHYQPTLLWLAPYVGLDTNYALDVLALFGAFLAFTGIVSQKFCTIPLFTALWSLYFSLYQIQQSFVTLFDDFLLETGFLAIFVAPLLPGRRKGNKGSPKDYISLWLLKWLLFRYFVIGSLNKFINGDPIWWTLKGLIRYYEVIPLPTPLSWYAFNLPQWFLKLSMVYTDITEIVLPFLYFIPIRSVRLTGFFLFLFLQMCILLTGNFGFSNLLCITLSMALLDDQCFYKKKSGKWSIMGLIANVLIHGAIIYGAIQVFSLKLNGQQIESNIVFSKSQFDQHITKALLYIIYFGLMSLAGTVLYALSSVLFDNHSSGNKFISLITTIFYAGIAVLLFMSSTVPIASIKPGTNATVNPTVRTIYNRLHKLRAVNHYPSFVSKFPAVQGRYEIILEGSNKVDGPWREYNFLYKPGNPNSSLPFVAPHSPQLDWHLSVAAYSKNSDHPWFLSLIHRILNHKSEVLALTDFRDSPYRQEAPKYIRALLYRYEYTRQRNQRAWWTRGIVGEYLSPTAKDSEFLIEYLKARNLLPVSSKVKVNPLWKQCLDFIRYIVNHLEASLLFWSVLSAGFAIISTTSGSGANTRKK